MKYVRQAIQKTCGICGTTFRGKGNQKFCSRTCAKKRQEQQLADGNERRRTCPHCGRTLALTSRRRHGKKND